MGLFFPPTAPAHVMGVPVNFTQDPELSRVAVSGHAGTLTLILSGTGTEGTLQHSGPSAGLVGRGKAGFPVPLHRPEVACEFCAMSLKAGPRASWEMAQQGQT